MDLVLALAARIGADIAIANDPDADRCAVAIPGSRAGAGGSCAVTRSARCSPTT